MKIGIISFAHPHAYGYADSLRKIDGVQIVGIADDDQKRGENAALERLQRQQIWSGLWHLHRRPGAAGALRFHR